MKNDCKGKWPLRCAKSQRTFVALWGTLVENLQGPEAILDRISKSSSCGFPLRCVRISYFIEGNKNVHMTRYHFEWRSGIAQLILCERNIVSEAKNHRGFDAFLFIWFEETPSRVSYSLGELESEAWRSSAKCAETYPVLCLAIAFMLCSALCLASSVAAASPLLRKVVLRTSLEAQHSPGIIRGLGQVLCFSVLVLCFFYLFYE